MKYEVKLDRRLKYVYSEIRLGCLRFTADVKGPDEGFWNYMNNEVLPKVREDIGEKDWGDIPGIRGSRLCYKAFGRNPGRYRVSSEALIRRIKREDDLYRINTVVDVNNLISVKSGLSVGSYDLGAISGDIVFRKARAGEGYTGIGKEFIDMENMLVLVDDEGLFGSSMSDSTRAMVSEESKDILVIIYCFEDDINLGGLLEEAKAKFEEYAGAMDVETWIVSPK